VVAYTYHATAQTLYDAHIKPRPPAFVHGRVQPTQPHVPERTLWSYIVQIAGAMKAAHDQGLAVRMIDVTKVIVTGRNRLRISSCGLADVLTYNPTSPSRLPGVPIPTEQIQEDLVMFGKLILALCCNNVAAMSNFGKSLDVVTQHYSADLKNVALFCLSKPGVHKVMPLPRSPIMDYWDANVCTAC
jgi:PAB-dependent poly(A)-specific ribonuclease subunit 3